MSAVLRACKILLQQYRDGLSCRRTSLMAGQANGVPVASNLGHLSELWLAGCGDLTATPTAAGLPAAAADVLGLAPAEMVALGCCGAGLHRAHFSLARTLNLLMGSAT